MSSKSHTGGKNSDVSGKDVSTNCGDPKLSEDFHDIKSPKEAHLEPTEILTELSRSDDSQILQLIAETKADHANFNTIVDSLNSEKQILLERIAALTEQTNRRSTIRENILSHPASFVCVLAIIVSVFLVHWNTVSENRMLREQKDKLETENPILRKQISALTNQNDRQASRIEKLETISKEQSEGLRDYKIKLDAMKDENLLRKEQIEFANKQMEFLQSQMKKVNDNMKENGVQAKTAILQERMLNSEGMNYLVRCLRDKDSASETFTGLKLFWGAIQVGYATKSGLNNCLTMYEAHYARRIMYHEAEYIA